MVKNAGPLKIFPHANVILLDIEGTICPISFVKDVLFPYALSALPRVCASQWNDDDFQTYVAAFPAEFRHSPDALIAHVHDLTARDVKIAYLKNLQGYLWKEGYTSGAIASPLFPDVVPKLRDWHARGCRLAIYSSGSVAAQRLLLQFVRKSSSSPSPSSGEGTEDIRSLFEGYFDTVNAGLKTETASYVKIAEALGVEKGDLKSIAFFSDNVKESRAAQNAGLTSVVVVREGNGPLGEEEKRTWEPAVIENFGQVTFQQ